MNILQVDQQPVRLLINEKLMFFASYDDFINNWQVLNNRETLLSL